MRPAGQRGRLPARSLTGGRLTPNLKTPGLELRTVALADATFFLRLRTEPSWLEACGYGIYVVEAPSTPVPMGLCGLVKRDFLRILALPCYPPGSGRVMQPRLRVP